MIFSFLSLLTALWLSASSGENTQVTVRVTNLKAIKGQVQLGLYNTASDFPKIGKEFRKILVPVDALSVAYTIKDLPIGNYALAIYHDENADGLCNLNFLGIPKEPYGFSNNVRPVFKAPSFRDTQFKAIKGNNIQIEIKLIQ